MIRTHLARLLRELFLGLLQHVFFTYLLYIIVHYLLLEKPVNFDVRIVQSIHEFI